MTPRCTLSSLALIFGLTIVASVSHANQNNGTVYLPLAFYSPDTGAGISYTMLYFSTRDLATGTAGTNTVRVTALYTQQEQHMAAIGSSWFIGRGLWKLTNSINTQHFPRDFYGIGNTTAEEQQEEYTYEKHSNRLSLQRWMDNDWYVGGTWVANQTEITEHQEDSLVHDYYSTRNLDMSGTFHAVGIKINRDTADAPIFPRNGSKTNLSALFYPEELGAQKSFANYNLSHRIYLPLGRGGALALEVQGEHASANTPLPLMPRLGSGSTLRGYSGGRYIDNLYLSGQVEARFSIYGRWQGTLFTAAGDVFPGFDEVSSEEVKYGVGGGIRYALQQEMRINVRLDIAYGFAAGEAEDGERPGIYFNFTEAF